MQRSFRLALGGLAALAVAMGIGRFVYTPILPAMVEAGELSAAGAGVVASANFAGYLVGALLAAVNAVALHARWWLLLALVVSPLSTAAMAIPGSLAAFSALRFVGGAASAFVLVLASSIVLERLSREGRPRLTAVHFAGVGVGIAASSILVSALADVGVEWRGQWVAAGMLGLVGSVVAVLGLTGARRSVPSEAPTSGPEARRLPALVLAYGLFGFGYVITATFLVALVRGLESLRPIDGVVWTVVGLAAVPSVVLWTALARRLGRMPAFALACLVEAVGVLATVVWPDPAGVMSGAVLLGGTFMGITALGLAEARTIGVDGGRAVALMTAAFGLGQIVGPVFAGVVVDWTGDYVLPTVAAGIALIGAAAVTPRPRFGRFAPRPG